MRKIIALILAVMLFASMAIPSYAASNIIPINKIGITFKMPSISVPVLPDSVHEKVKTTIPSNFVNNALHYWNKMHPMNND